MKMITFPRDEREDIKTRLDKGYEVYTLRASDEYGKYEAGEILKTEWGGFVKVVDKKSVDGGIKKLEKEYKFFDKLTDRMLADLADYQQIDILTLIAISESIEERANRIFGELKKKYPGKAVFDLDGRGLHFVCELEPTVEHSEYDRAVEVIISSTPHKHLKTTQYYKILSGTLELHVDGCISVLNVGDEFEIPPGQIHWAKSDNECWVEIHSQPGWIKEDHIAV